jgi:hypothetical protein
MIFGKLENKLESKDSFRDDIANYFTELANSQIQMDLLHELIDKITNTQYDNYKRFWNQYPKSRKRYSKLKLEDLEHPFTHYLITNFFKDKEFENYKKYSMILLKLTEKEFIDYEMNKYQYENK